MSAFEPVDPAELTPRLVRHALDGRPDGRPLRMALDAPHFVDLAPMATALRTAAERAGSATVVVDARDFYRDASLRFEYGRTDLESFYSGWTDRAALRREVLGPAGRNDGWYLPTLRDRDSNRMTRAPRAPLAPDAVVLLTGTFLIHPDLELDLVVHLSVSRQARRRQVPAGCAWTLPAYDRYDIDIDPLATADVVVRYDDPRHPAVRWSGPGRREAR